MRTIKAEAEITVEELSVKEIAKMTGQKESTVKSQLHRAREMLKEMLGEIPKRSFTDSCAEGIVGKDKAGDERRGGDFLPEKDDREGVSF